LLPCPRRLHPIQILTTATAESTALAQKLAQLLKKELLGQLVATTLGQRCREVESYKEITQKFKSLKKFAAAHPKFLTWIDGNTPGSDIVRATRERPVAAPAGSWTLVAKSVPSPVAAAAAPPPPRPVSQAKAHVCARLINNYGDCSLFERTAENEAMIRECFEPFGKVLHADLWDAEWTPRSVGSRPTVLTTWSPLP
jgi:hypothetical protein